MGIKAKLIIDDLEINILTFSYDFNQASDVSGRPSQRVLFDGLTLTIETQKEVSLVEWMVAKNLTKQIQIHIFPRVIGGRIRRLYLYDAHLVNWRNNFSSTNEKPVSETLTITAGGFEDSFSEGVFSTTWRETFSDSGAAAATVIQEQEYEPKLLGYHIEDLKNNEIKESTIRRNQEIFLVIKSKNTKGVIADIDLKNESIDYEYGGEWMEDDIIKDIILNDSVTKVKLKAIKQKRR